jgi:regulator of sigma E protease
MNLLLTLAAFVVALSVLIVIHEFGHYWVARRCGVKVLCFSVGFGRALWSRTFGPDRTELRIALIPLGGYVKMLDEREGDVAPSELQRAFNRKSVWQRFAIVAAGPAANFIAAVVLYWALFLHGMPGVLPILGQPLENSVAARSGFAAGDTVVRVDGKNVPSWQDFRWIVLQHAVDRSPVQIEVRNERQETLTRELQFNDVASKDLEGDLLGALGFVRFRIPLQPVIGEVVAGGAAARAGLQSGDLVVSIDGDAIDTWDTLVGKVRAAPDRELRLRVRRGEIDLPVVSVVPDRVEGNGSVIGRIGAGPRLDEQAMQRVRTEIAYGPVEGFGKAVAKTWETALFSLRMLGKMIVGEMSLKNLSGPITIADYAGQSAQNGWISYLLFLALISISLGVLNLLPVPLLDGGHLMYYSVEILTGKPVSERVMEIGQQIGMTLLFAMMAFAFYNDIHRLVSS